MLWPGLGMFLSILTGKFIEVDLLIESGCSNAISLSLFSEPFSPKTSMNKREQRLPNSEQTNEKQRQRQQTVHLIELYWASACIFRPFLAFFVACCQLQRHPYASFWEWKWSPVSLAAAISVMNQDNIATDEKEQEEQEKKNKTTNLTKFI